MTTETTEMTTKAAIEERGNGFPEVGEHVAGDDGELYLVIARGSRIETQPGRSNICTGYHLALADWSDLDEDEEPAEALALLAEDEVGERALTPRPRSGVALPR